MGPGAWLFKNTIALQVISRSLTFTEVLTDALVLGEDSHNSDWPDEVLRLKAWRCELEHIWLGIGSVALSGQSASRLRQLGHTKGCKQKYETQYCQRLTLSPEPSILSLEAFVAQGAPAKMLLPAGQLADEGGEGLGGLVYQPRAQKRKRVF